MSHTYSFLLTHIVFSTKDRIALITENQMRDRLYSYISAIINKKFGFTKKINGTADHVHVLLDIKTSFSISEIVRVVKSNSSKWINDNFNLVNNFAWQVGYGAFAVSMSNEEKIVQYINNQEKHHEKFSYKEELILLLKRHGIQYDEKYLWQ